MQRLSEEGPGGYFDEPLRGDPRSRGGAKTSHYALRAHPGHRDRRDRYVDRRLVSLRRFRMSLDHYVNDERQAMLTFVLLAIMAVVAVALISYAVLVA